VSAEGFGWSAIKGKQQKLQHVNREIRKAMT
jgi:hypothetical protein